MTATLTTLVSFNGATASSPTGQPDRRRQRRPVRHDDSGGANGDGTVFEIAKTADRLRQHADHPGQLQRRRRTVAPEAA